MAPVSKKAKSRGAELAEMVNKAFGTDVVKMGSDPFFNTSFIRTGVLPIDVMLTGGLPRRRTTEFYGGFSTLKSYIGLKAIASTQEAGGVAVLVDTEGVFDPEWATSLGVNVDQLILPPVETGEEAVDITQVLMQQGVDLVVWDSVAATMPQDEGKKRMSRENIQPGRQAALMSVMLRRLTSVNKRTALMFINQTRMKIGIAYGNPETTPGGHALPFYASARIAMRKAGQEKSEVQGTDGTGKLIKVKQVDRVRIVAHLEKSKLSKPHAEMHFDFDLSAAAIDEIGWAMGYGQLIGAITRPSKTQWRLFSYPAVTGQEKFHAWLASNPDKMMELTSYCLGRFQPASNKDGGRKLKLRKP